jgi:hypothetical protein
MRRYISVLLVGLCASPFSIAGDTLILHDGTPVRLRLGRNLSSADTKVGETADFEVLDELAIDGALLVPRGGTAIATVTEAQSKRGMARGGKLDVNIDYVRLADGEKVALRAVKENRGGGHTGTIIGATASPVAPVLFFAKGKDVTIPKGTEITAYINGEIKLERDNFTAALPGGYPVITTVSLNASAPVAAPAPQAPRRRPASIAITSDPASADIELNGKFIGNTPSTVEVQPGPANVVVKKGGFRGWSRTVDLSEGSVISLRAELERETPSIVFVRPAK